MQRAMRQATVRGARTMKPRASKSASEAARPRSPDRAPGAVGIRDLEREIAEIERLALDDLRTRWRNLSGRLAPAHLSRSLLARILAYRVQAQACGDLDRNTARALERWNEPGGRREPNGHLTPGAIEDLADRSPASERRICEPLILKPGTLLTREWQGRMETVMAVPGGFAWNGETFARLSAVAWAITGTKWNGHRFFGVRPQDRVVRSPENAGDPQVRVERGDKARAPRQGLRYRRPSSGSTVQPPGRGGAQ
jgi:Protein of unknown function (DUF2924)